MLPIVGTPVFLAGQGDITLSEEPRTLDGVKRDAIIVGLRKQAGIDINTSYLGSCDRRPEANTCETPIPVEQISGVQSDCCGRVFIEFRGCVEMVPLADKCGVVIMCDVDVDDACPAKNENLPDDDGSLPDQGVDECEDPGPSTPRSRQTF